MTSEAKWLALYTRLGGVLGPEHAETLMTGFSTRADVLELKDAIAALDHRFDRIDGRLDRFGEQLQGLYKTIVWSVVASVTVLAGIFSAIITILIR